MVPHWILEGLVKLNIKNYVGSCYGPTDRPTDGRMDGPTNGQTDGWTLHLAIFYDLLVCFGFVPLLYFGWA